MDQQNEMDTCEEERIGRTKDEPLLKPLTGFFQYCSVF